MNLSKEHKLAIKISIILLFFAFFLSTILPYYNHFISSWNWYQMMWKNANNKYLIFIILAIIIYFVSYFLAKITIKPIEEHNEELKNYNHNLAHELKTPLSIIKTNLELLEINFDKEYINSSKEEVNTMKDIIDWLLFLSEKNVLIKKEKISFSEIINKYKTDILDIEIKNDYILYWNEVLIDRMFKNLIDNSIKYNIGNKKIKIFLDKNIFTIENHTDLKINNNDIEKLYDTFFQADNSRNTIWYGLWLSIVKKIIKIHNLKINIKIENWFFKVIIN